MWTAIGVLGFVGLMVWVIALGFNLVRRTGRAKRWAVYCAICFVLFVVGVAASPSSPSTPATIPPTPSTASSVAPGTSALADSSTAPPAGTSTEQLSSQPSEQRTNHIIAATVTRVIDGDTAEMRLESGTVEKVRFIGVDTPESTTQVEPYGKEAAEYTDRALSSKKVYLELDVGERDKYGRLLAYVWMSPPAQPSDQEIRDKMFNARLLLDGYAQLMTVPPNVKYADYFVKFQREARDAGKGLWQAQVSQETTTPATSSQPATSVTQPLPSEQKKEIVVYVTRTGEKYHRGGCRYLSKSQIPMTLQDAKASGYTPCSVCNPPR